MKNICYLLLLISPFAKAQVGIGTTTPNATLEIASSSETTPANTDGLLIPKIEEFPATNPTASQDGMMVYVTGNGSITKGFYYWDNAITNWVTAYGAEKINDLTDGKSDNDGTNDGSSIFLGIDAGLDDDETDNQNVGVGYQALYSNTTGGANVANGFQALYENMTGINNTANGFQALYSNTAGNINTASGYRSLSSNTTGSYNTATGFFASVENISGNENTAYGSRSLNSNILGDNNTALGVNAGTNSLGNANISCSCII